MRSCRRLVTFVIELMKFYDVRSYLQLGLFMVENAFVELISRCRGFRVL